MFRIRFDGGANAVSGVTDKTITLQEGENLLTVTGTMDYSDRTICDFFVWELDAHMAALNTVAYIDCLQFEKGHPTPWHIGAGTRTPERYTLTTVPCPAVHGRGLSIVMPVASTTAVTRTIWRQGAYRLYIDGADNKAKFTNGIATAATSALTWAIGDKVHVYGGRDGTNLIVGAKVGTGAYVEGSTAGAHVTTDSLLWLGNRTIAPFFDGVDDLITVTDAASIQNVFDGGGTVEAIIRPVSDGENDNGRVYDKTSHRLYVHDEDAGTAKLGFWVDFDGAADGLWTTDNRVINLSAVNTVKVEYDADAVGNDPVITVNDVVVAITEDTTPVGTRITDAGSDLIVGNNAATDRTFHGLIWDFNYNDVTEYPLNEATGTTVYDSVGANNGVITGCAWQALSCVDAVVYNFVHHEGSLVSIANYMAGVS